MAKNRIRSFVAVELAPQIRDALADETARLAALGADVNWVAPENLHMTLKFLGQVERRTVPEVLKGLESAAAASASFHAEVTGAFFFPSPTRPRVVASGVDPAAASSFEALAERVEEELGTAGLPRSDKAFRAHVTLGRVKSPRNIRDLADALVTAGGEAFGEQEVEEMTLFMSELSRHGPTYTALGRVRIGAGRRTSP